MAECVRQFAGSGTPTTIGEFLGLRIDLAANGKREKPAGHKPIDHGLIEPEIPEQIREQEVYRIAVGEADIEVKDIKAASAGHTRTRNQLPSQVNRRR